MGRKTKFEILNGISHQNLMKGKSTRFFTDGFFGDLLEIREYIAYVNALEMKDNKRRHKLELVFDDNQRVNTVAFIGNDIKVGDFVKVIGFFYEGFERIDFYCKGITKIIPNAKEVEEFNILKCYEMSLPITLSKVELSSVYKRSDNFIKIEGLKDYYYIDGDKIQNEIELI